MLRSIGDISNIIFEACIIWRRSTGSSSGGVVRSSPPSPMITKPGIGHQVETLIPDPGLPPVLPVRATR